MTTGRGQTPAAFAYERRITMFVDFLGFKDLVEQSETNPSIIAAVHDAVSEVRSTMDSEGLLDSEVVTQFSDCLIVSVRADEASSVFHKVNALRMIVVDLADRGFLLRGGMTVGQLYHTDELVMGPAMNEAYRLESTEAISPRVIIDPGVIEAARAAPREGHRPDQEARYTLGFLNKDDDGWLYVDYVGIVPIQNLGIAADGYPPYLHKLIQKTLDGLRHEDGQVRRKYEWLDRRIGAEIDRLTAIGEISERRATSPEFYEAVDEIAASYEAAKDAMAVQAFSEVE